jgi:deoxyribodipyrimidine photo-lyase
LTKKTVNIVWFKRDLRFTDNEALFNAHQAGIPLLLVYFFEPSVMNYDDADVRHWRFIYESLQDLQKKLTVDVLNGLNHLNRAKEIIKNMEK